MNRPEMQTIPVSRGRSRLLAPGEMSTGSRPPRILIAFAMRAGQPHPSTLIYEALVVTTDSDFQRVGGLSVLLLDRRTLSPIANLELDFGRLGRIAEDGGAVDALASCCRRAHRAHSVCGCKTICDPHASPSG